MRFRILGPLCCFAAGIASAASSHRTLTLDGRVEAQRAIERVYWSHRTWPAENPDRKPTLDALMSEGALRAKVQDYLRKSRALEAVWHRPVTATQLQAELDRMVRHTNDGRMLRELFAALGDDPYVIAETLARQTLVDRLIRGTYEGDAEMKIPFDSWWEREHLGFDAQPAVGSVSYTLAAVPSTACVPESWSSTGANVPDGRRYHVSVWTGAEMIVFGGDDGSTVQATGGRYDPATDTWENVTPSGTSPSTRQFAAAVWTGTELIVWGGWNGNNPSTRTNTGGRYNPLTDTWTATSTTNAPTGRQSHTAVWTGSQMIVWGGVDASSTQLNTGGRYSPSTDSWTATAVTAPTPSARQLHSAVWTGSEMIVWGGLSPGYTDTGARYSPGTNSWVATSTGAGLPTPREGHTALWTGSEMIVWGGHNGIYLNTGGRYDPATDTWAATATSGAPIGRYKHTGVWTGSEMIVWGGRKDSISYTNTGGRYDPVSNSWGTVSTGTNVPTARYWHTAVWTGSQMMVWGGSASSLPVKTGGRYDPSTDTWTPTSTVAVVPDGGTNSVAIWTGSEMIVWGGYNGFTSVGGGGRYDPATDAWTPTPTLNAPSGRSFATAVWTGTEMIVWGGLSTLPLDSGARYNPVTNAWMPVTASGAPAARYKHTAVWTGSEMIVFGGTGSTDILLLLDTGGRYDPWFNSWAPIASGSIQRTEHTAVWTGGTMIVWGGTTYTDESGLVYTNSGETYTRSTNTWTPVSTGAGSPTERKNHTSIWTGSTMLVFGGTTTPPPPMVNTGGEYDPQVDAWSPTSVGAGPPGARTAHTAVWTGSDMIVWGGDAQFAPYAWRTGGRYDPASDTWVPTGTTGAPAGRSGHRAVWTGSRMIVWGGGTGSSQPQNSGGVYCACPDGVLLYRDADGDGLGDPADVRSSCDGAAVVGYVANAGDCDDSLIENTAPAAATGMMFAADKFTITWTPTPGAVRYDVVRGRLDLFPVGPGGGSPPFGGDETCYSNLTAPVLIDPQFFGFYWYLVRGENRCGIGSWGTASNGTERVTSTCP